jgi:TfoX/Sxy family transcriptional regulator of competence genes
MSTSKEYLEFVLEQLSDLENINYRAMMGEYILYYNGKIIGGVYDDRLLVKPVNSAISYLESINYEVPYEGSKEMLLVDNVDDKKYLAGLFNSIFDELPIKKKKGK